MVDAAASFDGNRLAATEASPRALPAMPRAVGFRRRRAEGLAAYAGFCRSALFAPAQGAIWILQLGRAGQAGSHRGDAQRSKASRSFALALEVVSRGPFRVARFMGGRHANGNFAAADPQWLARADGAAIRSMLAAIAKARPDIDLIALERLLPDLDGVANPLASLCITLPAPIFRWPSTSPAASTRCCCAPAASASARSIVRRRASSRPSAAFRRIEAQHSGRGERAARRVLRDEGTPLPQDGHRQRLRRRPDARLLPGDCSRKRWPRTSRPSCCTGWRSPASCAPSPGRAGAGKRLICEFGAIAEDDLATPAPAISCSSTTSRKPARPVLRSMISPSATSPTSGSGAISKPGISRCWSPLTLKGRALALALRQVRG